MVGNVSQLTSLATLPVKRNSNRYNCTFGSKLRAVFYGRNVYVAASMTPSVNESNQLL